MCISVRRGQIRLFLLRVWINFGIWKYVWLKTGVSIRQQR
jgi:hypothetical protein